MKRIIFILFVVFMSTAVYGQAEQMVSMNFDNVDLKVLIKFMSELTGKSFIIDDSVKGKATVISPKKIPVDEAYKVLESILVVNGYTTVPSQNTTKVMPLNEAKQLDIETHIGKEILNEDLKDRMITQIVPLECANTSKLESILKPYVSSAGYISSYVPTNTLIITDTSSNLTKLLSILNDLDQPSVPGPENVHVYSVQNTDCVSLSHVLNKVYLEKKQQSTDEIVTQPPTIVPDNSSNSIIILTSPQEYAFIKALVDKLDRRKPQVLVEALIAEIGLEKSMELGLEMVAAGGIVYGSQRAFAGASSKGIIGNILTGGGMPGMTMGVVEGETNVAGVNMPNLGLLVIASKDDDDINILSIPQIMATDNQESQILVGQNLAFIKNSQVTPEGSTVKTFEYKDVGILLKLTPHITDDDYVRMDVIQQVEHVIGQSFEGAVETSKREAVTTITVKDNSTAVIGGLILDKTTESVEKVPLLGDIPIVNILFKSTKTEDEKVNLFIFITPHIIRTDSEINEITNDRKKTVGQTESEETKEEIL